MKHIVFARAFLFLPESVSLLMAMRQLLFCSSCRNPTPPKKKKKPIHIPKLITDSDAAISRLTFTPQRLSRASLRCASLQLHSEPTKF